MKKNIISISSLIIIFLIWFLVAYLVSEIREVDFPTPLSTLKGLLKNLKGEKIYDYSIFQHTFTSLGRWAFAYLIAVLIGILLGFLLGIYPILYKLFIPFVYAIQLVPGLAWIPIALLLFGLGSSSTLFMIFILGIIPIIITTSSGIRDTSPDLINTATYMGANKVMLFKHVLLPSSVFHIVDGMRIALASSWRVLIAAEMIVGKGLGLGYIIIQSRWSLDYTSSFISILIIVSIGLVAEKLVFKNIEKHLREKYGYKE
ncbi:MAG: ABC transporter permease subunit [Marinifilum sp.]|jgi:ABC-type nitrate/sulfonate/bicarbonate transport system permease component|nr:ABC transporter permease subunit [Marinifilum sp.]